MGTKPLADGAIRRDVWDLDVGTVRIVGVHTDDGPEHPLYDPGVPEVRGKLEGSIPLSELDEDRIASVREFGQIQVATVVRDGRGADAPIYVEKGRHRWLWVTMANRRLPPGAAPIPFRAVLVDPSESESSLRMGAENAHREIRPERYWIELASRQAAKGVPVERIAIALGRKAATVRSWVRLAKMTPAAIAAVSDHGVAISRVLSADKLASAEQAVVVAGMVAEVKAGKAQEQGARKAPEVSTDGVADDKPARPRKPSKRVVTSLVCGSAAVDSALPAGFLMALRWQRGEVKSSDVPGLVAALTARAVRVYFDDGWIGDEGERARRTVTEDVPALVARVRAGDDALAVAEGRVRELEALVNEAMAEGRAAVVAVDAERDEWHATADEQANVVVAISDAHARLRYAVERPDEACVAIPGDVLMAYIGDLGWVSYRGWADTFVHPSCPGANMVTAGDQHTRGSVECLARSQRRAEALVLADLLARAGWTP